MKIGLVANAVIVPGTEFDLCLQRLEIEGFNVQLHPGWAKKNLFYAGTTHDRVEAFIAFAYNPNIDALWCIRAGHGSSRIIPALDQYTKENGIPPRKSLIGFSGENALMEYVRSCWNWQVIHSTVPGTREFAALPDSFFKKMRELITQKSCSTLKTRGLHCKWITGHPKSAISGTMIGGNLTLWSSMMGVKFHSKSNLNKPFDPKGKIIFLEEVGQSFPKIQLNIFQIWQAGGFAGAKAIILGTFHGCHDHPYSMLTRKMHISEFDPNLNEADPSLFRPSRKTVSLKSTLNDIFTEIYNDIRVPAAYKLEVGHGPGILNPIPLGVGYKINPKGEVKIKD